MVEIKRLQQSHEVISVLAKKDINGQFIADTRAAKAKSRLSTVYSLTGGSTFHGKV